MEISVNSTPPPLRRLLVPVTICQSCMKISTISASWKLLYIAPQGIPKLVYALSAGLAGRKGGTLNPSRDLSRIAIKFFPRGSTKSGSAALYFPYEKKLLIRIRHVKNENSTNELSHTRLKEKTAPLLLSSIGFEPREHLFECILLRCLDLLLVIFTDYGKP